MHGTGRVKVANNRLLQNLKNDFLIKLNKEQLKFGAKSLQIISNQ